MQNQILLFGLLFSVFCIFPIYAQEPPVEEYEEYDNTNSADIWAESLPNVSSVAQNESFSYSLKIGNNGPDAAENVNYSIIIPIGTSFVSFTGTDNCSGDSMVICLIPSLASGDTRNLQVVVNVNSDTDVGTKLYPSPYITSSTFDPDTTNNGIPLGETIVTEGTSSDKENSVTTPPKLSDSEGDDPDDILPPKIYGEIIEGRTPWIAYVAVGDITFRPTIGGYEIPGISYGTNYLGQKAVYASAEEAIDDFLEAGYTVLYDDQADAFEIAVNLQNENIKAFWFIGHGRYSGDEVPVAREDAPIQSLWNPQPRESIWIPIIEANGGTPMKASGWSNPLIKTGTTVPLSKSNLNQVTMHACGQNLPGWKSAFSGAEFDSWSTTANVIAMIMPWQMVATYPEIDENTGDEISQVVKPTKISKSDSNSEGNLCNTCSDGNCTIPFAKKSMIKENEMCNASFNVFFSDDKLIEREIFFSAKITDCVIEYDSVFPNSIEDSDFNVILTPTAFLESYENPEKFTILVDDEKIKAISDMSISDDTILDGFRTLIFPTDAESLRYKSPDMTMNVFENTSIPIKGTIDEITRGAPVEIQIIKPDGMSDSVAIVPGPGGTFDYLYPITHDTVKGNYQIIVLHDGKVVGKNVVQIIGKQVPSWIKNNAGWWAEGKIDDSSFFEGIQYLIKQGIIHVSAVPPPEKQTSQGVPDWIKTSAKWWADGLISEEEFIRALEYLIRLGILYSPTLTDVNLQNQEDKKASDDDSVLDYTSPPIGDLFVEVKYVEQATLYDVIVYEVTWGNKGISDTRGNKLLINLDTEIPILSIHETSDCKLIKDGKNYIECSVEKMNPGDKHNFIFTIFVNEAAFIDGIDVHMKASTSSADKNLQNNSLLISQHTINSSDGLSPPDSLPKIADLSLRGNLWQSDEPMIRLVTMIANHGPDDAESVQLVIQNPFSSERSSITSSKFSCSEPSLVIICTIPILPSSTGDVIFLTSFNLGDISMSINPEQFTASVSSNTFDPIVQNNYLSLRK